MAMNPLLILLWYLLVGCGYLGLGAVRADPRDVTEEVACQDSWVRIHRGCYIFEETDELDWEQSKQHCIDLGGELAVIQSLNEKMELQKYITTTNSGVQKWYIGLNRTSPTSTEWRWLDDTEFNLNFLRWAVPAHATRPGVVCGALELTPNNALDLAVIRCDRPQSFICEYHSITPRATTTIVHDAAHTTAPVSTPQPQDQELPTNDNPDAPQAPPANTSTNQEWDPTTTPPPPPTGGPDCTCPESSESESKESNEEQLERQNQASNTDQTMYQRYLQSQIDANEARVSYYTQVKQLYQEALEAQSQYFNSHRARQELEMNQLKQKSACS